MEGGHLVTEAAAKTGAKLRSQRNLRYQDQTRAPKTQRMLDDAHIDLGLAAASHPLQKKCRKALAQCSGDCGDGSGLVSGGLGTDIPVGGFQIGANSLSERHPTHQACLLEDFEPWVGALILSGELGCNDGTTVWYEIKELAGATLSRPEGARIMGYFFIGNDATRVVATVCLCEPGQFHQTLDACVGGLTSPFQLSLWSGDGETLRKPSRELQKDAIFVLELGAQGVPTSVGDLVTLRS